MPFERSTLLQRGVAPSLNVTAPGAALGDTVAVKAMTCPTKAGLGDDERAIDVVAWLMASVSFFARLRPSFHQSPRC
jgi:hypothetical protein